MSAPFPWVWNLVRFVICGAFALLAGCGGPAAPSKEPKGPAPAAQAPLERFFPLDEGYIFHYVTRDSGEQGMLVAKVHRSGPRRGELRLSNATRRFEYRADGVAYVGGAYVLKEPLDVGAKWKGEHGGTTRVSRVDVAPKVPVGSPTGCVETIEEGGRPKGSRYASIFCPGLGMVSLEVTAPGGEASAKLKHYGPPVKIQ